MKLFLAITAAAFAFTGIDAEAAPRKKRSDTFVVKVKPRSFLDAGTQDIPGRGRTYSQGLTPHRASDSIVPTGSAGQRLLPGRFGL
jgi:hypothetical protein